jgi:hypothetical protein
MKSRAQIEISQKNLDDGLILEDLRVLLYNDGE